MYYQLQNDMHVYALIEEELQSNGADAKMTLSGYSFAILGVILSLCIGSLPLDSFTTPVPKIHRSWMSISILFSHLGALYTCLHATELVSTLERLRDLAKHAIILTLLRYSSFYHIIRSCQEWTVRLIGIRCDSALRTDWVIKYAPSDGRSMTSNISYVKAGGLEIRSVTCTLLKLPEFLTSVRGAHYPAIKCTIGDTFPVLTPYYKWDSGILYFHKLGPR